MSSYSAPTTKCGPSSWTTGIATGPDHQRRRSKARLLRKESPSNCTCHMSAHPPQGSVESLFSAAAAEAAVGVESTVGFPLLWAVARDTIGVSHSAPGAHAAVLVGRHAPAPRIAVRAVRCPLSYSVANSTVVSSAARPRTSTSLTCHMPAGLGSGTMTS